MPGAAIGLTLPYGFAGNVSRGPGTIIEPKTVKSNSADIPFGTPVVLNSDDTVSHPSSVALTATNFLGISVAETKQGTTYTYDRSTQTGKYSASQKADIIKQGDVIVNCVNGTPNAGGTVYVRTVLSSAFPSEAVGDIRTSAESGKTVALTNACFKNNRKDANGMVELTLKYPNN